MLMGGKVNLSPAKLHAFHLQSQPLLRARLCGEFDFAAGAENPLPGKRTMRLCPKQPRHGAVIKRVTGSGRNLSVGSDLAFRDGANHPTESGIAQCITAGAVFRDLSEQFFRNGCGCGLRSRHNNIIIAWLRVLTTHAPQRA
jgi:hypothetical protein